MRRTIQQLRLMHYSLCMLLLTACSGNGAPFGYEFETKPEKPDTTATNPDKPETTLTVSPLTFAFPANGGVQTFSVISNTEWTARIIDGDNWISFTQETDMLIVTAKENPATTQRPNAHIEVATIDGKRSENITLKQVGQSVAPETTLSVEPLSHEFTAAGGKFEFAITSNTEWTAEILSSADWISIDQQVGRLVVEAQPNPDTTARPEARVRIYTTDEKREETITLTQQAREPDAEPVTLSLSTTEITLTSNSTTQTITVTSNAAWEVLPGYDNSWLQVETSDNTITITAASYSSYEKERKTQFTVQTTDGKKQETVKVTQQPRQQGVPGDDDNQTPQYSKRR